MPRTDDNLLTEKTVELFNEMGLGEDPLVLKGERKEEDRAYARARFWKRKILERAKMEENMYAITMGAEVKI